MKKLLGISLVAMLAVSPMMAFAEAPEGGVEAANATKAAEAPYYETVSATATTDIASTSYVKGAYNDAIKAVNRTYADLSSTIAANDSAMDSRVDSLESRATDLESTVGNEALATTAQTLTEAINELNSAISTNDSTMGGRVTSLESTVGDTTMTTTAQTVTGAINELNSAIAANDSAMDSRVDSLESRADGFDTSISGLESSVASLNSALTNATADMKAGVVSTINHSGTVVHTTWGSDDVAFAADTVRAADQNNYNKYYATHDATATAIDSSIQVAPLDSSNNPAPHIGA